MQTNLHLNKLLLRNPFGIHHGSYTYRYQLIVENVARGFHGYGETVAIDYYGITAEQLEKEARDVSKKIAEVSVDITTKEFYDVLLEVCPDSPFVRCAFDQSFIDLKAKMKNMTVGNFLNISPKNTPVSSITIGLEDSPELIQQRLVEPWPMYKLKAKNTLPYELISALNSKNKGWGIDANGSFPLGLTPQVINEIAELGGTYAEQIGPKHDWTSLKAGSYSIPHLADESVTTMASAKSLSAHCDGFVLKLTKCGGITPVIELIKYAKSENKKLLAGCMTESSIGINHMLALAPLFDYCDLDGAFLISNDEAVAKVHQPKAKSLQTNGKFQ